MMIRKATIYFLLLAVGINFTACSGGDDSDNENTAADINSFKSEQDFVDYLSNFQSESPHNSAGSNIDLEFIAVSSNESITNNQEAGVDEGDIVKSFQDYLIVLRKGKLISISTEGDLDSRDIVDSYAPNSTLGTWYDELIISGNTIVVLGYSYRVGATEIGLFNISDDGTFEHRDSYFLRSFDYYSSRNYASRLVGNELVFYMPYYLQYANYQQYLPAILNIDDIENQTANYEQIRYDDDWTRIIRSVDIYQPLKELEHPTLHSIVRCDLSDPEFSCSAKGIIAPFSRTFYVSQDAVYLWTSDYYLSTSETESRPNPSLVYQLPLDSGDIRVLESYGSPIDQFSFNDDGTYLHMLLRQHSDGDWMWNPEYTRGDLSYAQIPLSDFSDTLTRVDDSRYVPLNNPGYNVKNRFIGDYLIYGSTSTNEVQLLNTQNPSAPQSIELNSNVTRIDRLGDGAIAVGLQHENIIDELGESISRYNSNLIINTLALNNTLTLNDSIIIENAYEGENRSHGYNTTDTSQGSLFGLPIVRFQAIDDSNQDNFPDSIFWGGWYPESAEIIYMHANDDLVLEPLGSLGSEDNHWHSTCEVSCIDWYGNARPIFFQNKILALLGYELIEGEVDQNQLFEIDRVNFSPITTQD